MTKTQFIEKLAEELVIDPTKLTDRVQLGSLSAWDSLGRIAVITMLDSELAFVPEAGALQRCQTVGEIVELVRHRLDT